MTNGVTPEAVGFSSQRLSRINKMMQGYIDDGKLASGLTMLARRGETFHFEPYGMLDLESGAPVERDSLVPHLLDVEAHHQRSRHDALRRRSLLAGRSGRQVHP